MAATVATASPVVLASFPSLSGATERSPVSRLPDLPVVGREPCAIVRSLTTSTECNRSMVVPRRRPKIYSSSLGFTAGTARSPIGKYDPLTRIARRADRAPEGCWPASDCTGFRTDCLHPAIAFPLLAVPRELTGTD